MKVSELIKELQEYDPDLEIALKGYEGGYYSDNIGPWITDLAININTEWYYGPHEDLDNYSLPEKYDVKTFVIIS